MEVPTVLMRYFYLHGFASSPVSRKARLFFEKLQASGIHLEVLDLAPDFEKATITSQLIRMEEAIGGYPAVLIGSSLGGYLAALYASFHPQVDRLVLLAPAFDFYALWRNELGKAKLDEWRKTGVISVYHYGFGKQVPLRFSFIQDAELYTAFPVVTQPCLVLHGSEDAVVPFEKSAQFAAAHPGTTTLIALDSGHELTDVLNQIWNAASEFLWKARF